MDSKAHIKIIHLLEQYFGVYENINIFITDFKLKKSVIEVYYKNETNNIDTFSVPLLYFMLFMVENVNK